MTSVRWKQLILLLKMSKNSENSSNKEEENKIEENLFSLPEICPLLSLEKITSNNDLKSFKNNRQHCSLSENLVEKKSLENSDVPMLFSRENRNLFFELKDKDEESLEENVNIPRCYIGQAGSSQSYTLSSYKQDLEKYYSFLRSSQVYLNHEKVNLKKICSLIL